MPLGVGDGPAGRLPGRDLEAALGQRQYMQCPIYQGQRLALLSASAAGWKEVLCFMPGEAPGSRVTHHQPPLGFGSWSLILGSLKDATCLSLVA